MLTAPDVLSQLEAARQDTIGQAANEAQRRSLTSALGEHRITEHYRVGTHAGEQSLEWQKETATERLNQLRQQAALDYGDPDSIEAYGRASESAARERARTMKLGPDSDEAQVEVDAAQSSIWRSAIEAALDKMHTTPAIALFQQAVDRLSPSDSTALAPQIDAAKEHQAGQDYLASVPIPDTRDLAELDAAHQAATAQNEADWPGNDSQRATNQHFIDVAFNQRKRDAAQAKVDLVQAANDWLGQPGQTARPPLSIWSRLDPNQQRQADTVLLWHSDPGPETEEVPPETEPRDGLPNVEMPSIDPKEADTNPPSPPAYTASAALPTTALPESALSTVADVAAKAGRAIGPLAARVAPLVGTAGAAGAAALPLLLIPGNTQEETIDLGEGLRARVAPGQRSVSIERRANKGVLGGGFGAEWERLPIDANVDVDKNNQRVLTAPPEQLRAAIGNAAADRLLSRPGIVSPNQEQPMPIPPVSEMRIGVSTDGGKTISYREATEDQVRDVCPNYSYYQQLGMQASTESKAAGLQNGRWHGLRVHRQVQLKLDKEKLIQKLLEERGVFMLEPELALRYGVPKSYSKGSSRIDIVELHSDHVVVCIYDLKTGNAAFEDDRMARYAKEVGLFVGKGYTIIYLLPIPLP